MLIYQVVDFGILSVNSFVYDISHTIPILYRAYVFYLKRLLPTLHAVT